MWLYYYGGFEQTLSALKANRLPVLAVSESDNPFLYNGPMADNRRQGIGQDEYLAELKRQYQALPENLRSMVSFDYFQQQSEQKREQIEKAILQSKKAPSDAICYDLAKYNQLGYLPLYSSATHYGLWLQKAQQHQGICLELDAESGAFQAQPGQPALLKAVQYGPDKPIEPEPDNPFPGLFTLPEELALEKEWRFVKFLKHFSALQSGGFACSLPRGIVRSIYLGAQMSDENYESLLAWQQVDMNYKSVPVFRIVIDPYQLILRREPV